LFYHPAHGPDLPHNPFNALVVPRPIGWISTVDREGRANLAPYSFFNAVAYRPPQVMFAATTDHAFGGLKDSVRNAHDTGEFVVNLATWALREAMNASAVPAPHGVDEFEYAGLSKAPSQLVRPPRVAESPVHLECRYTQTVVLPADEGAQPARVVFGTVVGIHIDDAFIVDGRVDVLKLRPIGRLGYLDYVDVTNAFAMDRPVWQEPPPR
jgi:flavin reductase (DIM6/NTAB) family NADH-FMN oxidoreductase RutF